MKTTLSKLCICTFLLLVVSCARKASIYSDIFSTNFISQTFDNDVIVDKNIVDNKKMMNIDYNFGSFSSAKFVSINNSNGVLASAFASVTIIDPATISKTDDLVFQKISLKNLKNKFVNINEIGAGYHRILIPNTYTNAAQNIAEFKIGGGDNKAIDISVPNQILLFHSNGSDVLSASMNTQKVSQKSNDLNDFKFAIDGKVYFNSLAIPGIYYSKNFTVIVNYN